MTGQPLPLCRARVSGEPHAFRVRHHRKTDVHCQSSADRDYWSRVAARRRATPILTGQRGSTPPIVRGKVPCASGNDHWQLGFGWKGAAAARTSNHVGGIGAMKRILISGVLGCSCWAVHLRSSLLSRPHKPRQLCRVALKQRPTFDVARNNGLRAIRRRWPPSWQ